MKNLPHKTIERLSQYRRALLNCLANGKTHIFSHELAKLQHITAVQVRRDLMLIGYTGTLRKGYNVKELIDLIGTIIDSENGINVAIVGMGNLGRALYNYFSGKRTKLSIVATFDKRYEKIKEDYPEIECYNTAEMEKIIKEKKVDIGIMAVPAESATTIADKLVNSGVKGILNYTPKPVNVPKDVYLEEYDMITSLEKVAFFVKKQNDDV
ncbi:MAG: redox-sensing transcriptional repressor Rex [Bacteroidales bacterium]